MSDPTQQHFPAALAAVASVTALLAASVATAQGFPSRPVRIVVPYAAGGPVDGVARTVGQKLSDLWGQTVIVDNRPGGAANIGTDVAAKAAPDGHTILMGTTANGINLHLFSNMPYVFIRDFAPVCLLDTFANVLIAPPGMPAKSIKELIALAKAKPGQLSYATGGVASSGHFSGELQKLMAGIEIEHIPYKVTSVALTDVIGGRVPLMFTGLLATIPHMDAGRIRGLGVTSAQRSPSAPQLPTIAEAGVPGYELVPWHGMLVPAGTPKEVIIKLNADIVKVLAMPDVRASLQTQGIDTVIGSSPAQLAAFIRNETDKYGKLVKAIGLKKE